MAIGGSGVGSSNVTERFGSDNVGSHEVEGLDPSPSLQLPLYESLPGRITFTRASSGTFINRSGLLQTAGNNAARFDHSQDGNALGLLVEGSRQNEALHNRDLTNAAWVKTNTTAAKDAIGLDGVANSASTLTATANNGTCLQIVTKASVENAYSVDIRRKTGIGTVEITDNGGTNWTDVTSSINSSAYVRVSLIRTQANPQFGIRLGTSGDEIEVDFNQLEAGAFSTSRIETTTLAVTRAADVAQVTGADFSGWFNATQGAFITSFDVLGFPNGSGFPRVYEVSDGSTTERMTNTLRHTSDLIRIDVIDGGTSQVTVTLLTGALANALYKVAYAYAANDFSASLNGGSVLTDASGTLPTVDRLNIGSDAGGGSQLNGHVRQISYYPTRLSDAELRALST